jgi:hypothetical protein
MCRLSAGEVWPSDSAVVLSFQAICRQRNDIAVIHDHASTTAIQKPITLQLLPDPLATPTKPARKTIPVTIEYAL